jgi:hypothetical protein
MAPNSSHENHLMSPFCSWNIEVAASLQGNFLCPYTIVCFNILLIRKLITMQCQGEECMEFMAWCCVVLDVGVTLPRTAYVST